MSDPLNDRLNQILPKLVSEEFLSGTGLGNELAFHIFDYPPEHELRVRDFLATLLEHLPRQRPGLKVCHVNLFDCVLDYLRHRRLLDKALEMQAQKGDGPLRKALAGPLHEEKLAAHFGETIHPRDQNLVLLSGIGSVWPLLRSHALLNNLQPVLGQVPLVMFFPGRYDGFSLRLFGKLKNNNYYRAFKLIP